MSTGEKSAVEHGAKIATLHTELTLLALLRLETGSLPPTEFVTGDLAS